MDSFQRSDNLKIKAIVHFSQRFELFDKLIFQLDQINYFGHCGFFFASYFYRFFGLFFFYLFIFFSNVKRRSFCKIYERTIGNWFKAEIYQACSSILLVSIDIHSIGLRRPTLFFFIRIKPIWFFLILEKMTSKIQPI